MDPPTADAVLIVKPASSALIRTGGLLSLELPLITSVLIRMLTRFAQLLREESPRGGAVS